MIRIPVDLLDEQFNELTATAEAEQRSRAAVIRDAIAAYIALRKHANDVDVFGLWKNRKLDGLAYQQEFRSEW